MDLKALLQVLWHKKWILIIVPFFAICAAFMVRFFGEWKFVSTAQLATGLTVADELIANERALNPYEIQVTFNNLSEIIRSRTVIGQVSYQVMKHDLMDSVSAFRKFKASKATKKLLDKNIQAYLPEFRKLLDNKIDSGILLNPNKPNEKLLQVFIEGYGYDYESFVKNLTINRLNQSDFLEVSFVSENAQLSANVVNTVCTEFIRYYKATKLSSSNTSVASLELIANQRKQNLDEKMEELKKFRSTNEIFNSEAESEAKIHQIKNYEDQIADEQQKVRGLELTIASLNGRISNAESSSGFRPNEEIIRLNRRINVINEKYIQSGQSNTALLDSLTLLRTQLDAIMQRNNATVKLTPAELSALKNKRDESINELDIARSNLSSLNNIYNSMRFSIGSLANTESLGKALEKEVEVASEENQAAQNRLNEAKAQIVTNKILISQVLVAEPAEEAESRKTLIFMLFAGVLSFVLSAFVVIVIELTDSRIKNVQRFKQKTRLKLAGTLSKIGTTELNLNAIFNSNLVQNGTHEELRKIRFDINAHSPRILLVTSLRKSQGKSFFIIALAQSLSLLKKRILIIDTNLRNNSLTRVLLAQPNFGLLLESFRSGSKLLGAHGAEDGEPAAPSPPIEGDLITRTKNSLIDIIGNKKTQLSPSEVIPGGDFKVLLEWLKSEYDYILLEGPALNSYSDSKELIKFVDLVIPVFSAESSIDGQDIESLNYLKSLSLKLGSAVLNNVQQDH